MSEIKLNAEALEEAGAALGFAVAALIRGFQAGMDAYDVMLEETAIRETGKPKRNGNVRKRKSAIAGSCWCDQCARLEECEKIREGFTPGRGAPFPVRRLRKRNALQALRGTAMRRVRAGRRAEQWINKKEPSCMGVQDGSSPVRGCRIRLFNTLDSIARKRLFVKGRRLDVCRE